METVLLRDYEILYKKDKVFLKEGIEMDLLVNKGNNEQIVLNKTAKSIYEAVLNNDNTKDAFDEFCNKYTGVDTDLLSDDFNSILNILEIYEFINLKSNSKNENDYITVAGDAEYTLLSDYLNNLNSFYFNEGSSNPIDAVTLRQKTMLGTEYYCIKINAGKIVNCIAFSILGAAMGGTTLLIHFIVNEESFDKLLNNIRDWCNVNLTKCKVLLSFIEKDKAYKSKDKSLKKLNFKEDYIQKLEYGIYSVANYSLYFND